jgi:hypothetical protein
MQSPTLFCTVLLAVCLAAMGLDGSMPMSIDGQMLTPEQLAYMQQQQAAMAAAAAAAGQPY